MKIWWLFMVSSGLLFSKPLPPQDLVLDPDAIKVIGIHRETNTLLIFPDDVTLVLGKGLTDGSAEGAVQYAKTDNPRVVVLRHLGGAGEILMQVMLGEEAFVFRVHESENPATVIRFKRKSLPQPADKVIPEKVIQPKTQVSPARQNQLIMFARSPSLFEGKFPNQFKNFRTLETSSTHLEQGLETIVTRVSKFGEVDALVVSGKVSNKSAEIFSVPGLHAFLVVGEKRSYRLLKVSYGLDQLRPDRMASFEAILIGDGKGGAAHLSPENHFRLRLLKETTTRTP